MFKISYLIFRIFFLIGILSILGFFGCLITDNIDLAYLLIYTHFVSWCVMLFIWVVYGGATNEELQMLLDFMQWNK